MIKEIVKLANQFEDTLDYESSPPSSAPISIERHKDLVGSIRQDVQKSSLLLSSSMLEPTQKDLAGFIARSLDRRGFSISTEDVYKQLLRFGEYSKAEQELITDFAKAITNYSHKAVHYIINNLSW